MVSKLDSWIDSLRANHFGVFRDSGLDVKQYRYYDKKNISLDLAGMIEDIKVARHQLYLTIGCPAWFNNLATCLCPQSDRSRSHSRTVESDLRRM